MPGIAKNLSLLIELGYMLEVEKAVQDDFACYLEIYDIFLKEMRLFIMIWVCNKCFSCLHIVMYFLQGYWRCAVKKPKAGATIAWRNSCHEGKDLCSCVYAFVSVSPLSLHFVCVLVYLFGYYCRLTKTYFMGLFGEECSTFRKL